MHEKLLKHFTGIQPLTESEIAAIDETMDMKSFSKSTLLLEPGQTSTQVFFVLEGIVRQYYLVDGTEKTSDFFTGGQWVLSTNNVMPGTTVNHFLECCTDCLLAVGNSQKGETLYKQYPNLETVSRKLMTAVFIEQQEKIKTYVTDSPEQRYLKLMTTHPGLFQRIPQYQIASYIGVTPESLSRIRKRIAKK